MDSVDKIKRNITNSFAPTAPPLQCNANISREHAVQARRPGGKCSKGRQCRRCEQRTAVHCMDCTFWVVQALGFQLLRVLYNTSNMCEMAACMYCPKGCCCTQKAKGSGSEFVPSHIVPALFLLIINSSESAFGVQALRSLACTAVSQGS